MILFKKSYDARQNSSLLSNAQINEIDATFPIVMKDNILLGGMRFLSKRGEVATQDRCDPPPFAQDDGYVSWNGGTTVLRDLFGEPPISPEMAQDDHTKLMALEQLQQSTTQSYGNTTQCFLRTTTDEDFGPLVPTASGGSARQEAERARLEEAARLVHFPRVKCVPECTRVEGNDTEGMLVVFKYQSAATLGFPFDSMHGRPHPGGYAITLPGHVTYNAYREVMRLAFGMGHWLDRQTRQINIHIPFYNTQTHLVANVELYAESHTSGDLVTYVKCSGVRIDSFADNVGMFILEVGVCSWFIIRAIFLSSSVCSRKLTKVGGQPVRCVITVELIIHLTTTINALIASVFRFLFVAMQVYCARPAIERRAGPH
jgi:hypothetical protein